MPPHSTPGARFPSLDCGDTSPLWLRCETDNTVGLTNRIAPRRPMKAASCRRGPLRKFCLRSRQRISICLPCPIPARHGPTRRRIALATRALISSPLELTCASIIFGGAIDWPSFTVVCSRYAMNLNGGSRHGRFSRTTITSSRTRRGVKQRRRAFPPCSENFMAKPLDG